MRVFFFLLVLANLVFFVWAQGYLGGQDEGREPQRLADQLRPEAMKVTVREPGVVQAPAACRLVQGLTAPEAEQLAKTLGEGGELNVSLRIDEEPPAFWVSINALANQAAADRKAGELKLLGVTDFHVMQAEGGAFAISLGVFPTEAAAAEFLQGLNRKGVKSARADARPPLPVTRIEVRGAVGPLSKRLAESLAGFAAAKVVDCP